MRNIIFAIIISFIISCDLSPERTAINKAPIPDIPKVLGVILADFENGQVERIIEVNGAKEDSTLDNFNGVELNQLIAKFDLLKGGKWSNYLIDTTLVDHGRMVRLTTDDKRQKVKEFSFIPSGPETVKQFYGRREMETIRDKSILSISYRRNNNIFSIFNMSVNKLTGDTSNVSTTFMKIY